MSSADHTMVVLPKEDSVLLLNSSSPPPSSQIITQISPDNLGYDSITKDSHSIYGNETGNNYKEDKSSISSSSSSFYAFFISSSGPPQIMCLSLLYAICIGSTIGVVPAIMTTQYAHLRHGLDINLRCSDSDDYQQACIDGNNDALTASTVSSFVSHMIAFFMGSLVGSLSDEIGRRRVLLLGQGLALLYPLFLVLLQVFPMISPTWFYTAMAISNLVSWTTISLSAISDVIPHKWRASCFGLLLCGFSVGFALSPIIAIPLSHFGVSLLSLALLTSGFLYSLFFLPETLPKETYEETRRVRRAANAQVMASIERDEDSIISGKNGIYSIALLYRYRRQRIIITRFLLRPLRELLILNRSTLFRILATLAFFSGMSSAADQSLTIYYVEQQLQFNDRDVAYLFMIIGLLGIIVQGVLLNKFIYWLGERNVISIAFFFGVLSNILYAFASGRSGIYIGATVGCVTGMAFPTISAIKANNVDEHEQGQIQGALYALSSLAAAIGPVTLRLIYRKTSGTAYPGAFYLVASAFFLVAAVCAMALPQDKTNSNQLEHSYRYDTNKGEGKGKKGDDTKTTVV